MRKKYTKEEIDDAILSLSKKGLLDFYWNEETEEFNFKVPDNVKVIEDEKN
jgi:hypothetical protein